MTNKYKRTASAVSAAALALSGVMVPTNVFAAGVYTVLGSSYTLGEDTTACYEVKTGNITIDLNGYTLTCNDGHAIKVADEATVTIVDNSEGKTGNVVATKNSSAAVFNAGGNVTIEGGAFNATNWYTIKNLGNMTIVDGEFTQGDQSANSSLIANGWYNGMGDSSNDGGFGHTGNAIASLNITGGEFDHTTTTSTIKSDDYSKTTIDGGKFTSAQGYLIQATGEVLVKNGEFHGYQTVVVFNADGTEAYMPGKATITGGDFSFADNNGYIAKNAGSSADLTITGGEFTGLAGVINGDANSVDTTITGGNYNINVAPADGYTTYKTEDGYKTIAAGEFNASAEKLVLIAGEKYNLSEDLNIAVSPEDYAGEWSFAATDTRVSVEYTDEGYILTAGETTGENVVIVATAEGTSTEYKFNVYVDVVEGIRGGQKASDGNTYSVDVKFDDVIRGGKYVDIEKNDDVYNAIKDTDEDIKAVYDISVKNAADEVVAVEGVNTTVTLTINNDLFDDKYEYYQVAYVKDGKIAKYYDVAADTEAVSGSVVLTFTTDHLSDWAVLASNDEFEPAEDRNEALEDEGNGDNEGDGDNEGGDHEGDGDNEGGDNEGDGDNEGEGDGTTGAGSPAGVTTPDTGIFTTEAAAATSSNLTTVLGIFAVIALAGAVKFAKASRK